MTLVAHPSSTDTSTGDQAFTGAGAVTLTSDNGGSTWPAGTARAVTWTTTGTVGTSVRIDLVKGTPGTTVQSVTAPSTAGTVTWTPAAKLPTGSDYRVVLVAVSFPKLVDVSDAAVAVTGSTLSLAEPDAEWVSGVPRTITWTKTGAAGTAVALSLVPASGSAVPVTASTPLAAGTFTWTPPLTLAPGIPYRVRAVVVGNALVTDTTDAAVTLRTPSLSLSTPSSAATWTTGVPVDLAWSWSDGVTAPVTVQLLRGTAVVGMATGTSATSLRWTPPMTLAPASDYRIRVSATAATKVTATSAFTVTVVRPTVALTATAVRSGSPTTLSWQFSEAVVAPVRVDLLRGTTLGLRARDERRHHSRQRLGDLGRPRCPPRWRLRAPGPTRWRPARPRSSSTCCR